MQLTQTKGDSPHSQCHNKHTLHTLLTPNIWPLPHFLKHPLFYIFAWQAPILICQMNKDIPHVIKGYLWHNECQYGMTGLPLQLRNIVAETRALQYYTLYMYDWYGRSGRLDGEGHIIQYNTTPLMAYIKTDHLTPHCPTLSNYHGNRNIFDC